MTATTVLDAIADKHLFAPWFRDRDTWGSWFAFLAALFALPMTPEQLAIFQSCTGRTEAPSAPASEGWLVCGRRAGKSFMLALIAVFLSSFRDHRQHLAPGERGTVMVIATDRRQARIILRYIRALLTQVPMLARMIERETASSFDLDNGVTIEVHAASFRSTRGYAVLAALCDEAAYWPTEDSAEPDFEIINALRPGMVQFPDALLLCASSPYARRGALWDAWRKYHGKDGPVLVWKADTRTMNPTVPQSVVDAAYERDPASAAAEYGAEFRRDIESFIAREAVDAAVVPGRHELPPVEGLRYFGFADAAGGSGGDSFTAAVAHFERATKHIVVDGLRERRPPFSPAATIEEHAAFFKSYRVRKITADRWGGEFPVEQFRKHGIKCEMSERVKSDIYRELLPLLNSDRVELLDNQRLVAQLVNLERRTARSGKDSIDHPPGAHDDLANAAAGALVVAAAARPRGRIVGSPEDLRRITPNKHGRWSRQQRIPVFF